MLYEVITVIPEAGRDVQCSACGHTWFQQSQAAIDAEEAAAMAAAEAPEEWDVPETPSEPEPPTEPEIPSEPEPEPERTPEHP